MKKIMILGAAHGQIPFMEKARKLGAYIIAVSPKGNYPGFDYADECVYADTRDKETILKAAEERKIDAIVTDQTDVSVPTVAYVAEKLGLRGIGTDVALKFTNKYEMRAAAKEIGIGVPEFYKATTVEEALAAVKKIGCPVIVKPVDSSGSRGVIRINSVEDAEASIKESIKYSGSSMVIVEKFIVGREFLVDGIALDYKYRNLDIGIKEYFDINGKYISKMCMFTSADAYELPEEKEILSANERLVRGLKLPFGITHAEYLYSYEEQKVYLVEIAARGGGVYLSSDLTPRASGVDTNGIIVDYVLNGNVIDVDELILDKKTACWRCFELKEGTIDSIEGVSDTENIEGVFKVCMDDLKIGTKIGPLLDDTGKLGPILFMGDNRSECSEVLGKIEKTLKVTTSSENGRCGICW